MCKEKLAQGIKCAFLQTMLSLADVNEHACRGIERATLGYSSPQTAFLLFGCRQDRGHQPRPWSRLALIVRDSAGGLYQGCAVYGVKCALHQIVSHVTEQVKSIDHCLRKLLLHCYEWIVGRGWGAPGTHVISGRRNWSHHGISIGQQRITK